MKITKGTEPIAVPHPVFMLVGEPGISKSSLAMSMLDSLNLDFDEGVHRAINRRDSIQVPTWAVIEELLADERNLAPYQSVIVDTVGRCLDKLAVEIIRKDAKLGRGGALTQQGWGQLKSRFAFFIERLKALDKDILLVSHAKEDKDGDLRVARPDIQGGSLGEVLKSADFVGYLYMSGTQRILDFSPCDRFIGKNPAGWDRMLVPPPERATDFFAKLYAQGREALGRISDVSAAALREVEAWRLRIAACTTAAAYNALIPEIGALGPLLKPQIAKLLLDVAKSAGIEFDKDTKQFIEPAPKVVAFTPGGFAAPAAAGANGGGLF